MTNYQLPVANEHAKSTRHWLLVIGHWSLRFALIVGCGSPLMLTGCSAYVWGPGEGRGTGDEKARTVRLDTVENHLVPHRPGLEYELTDRLKEEIATDRRLILSEGAADVRLKVSLTRLTEPTLVEDLKTGDRAEIMLRATAVVEAIGEHYIGGRERRTVTRSVSYVPGLGDSRRDGLDRLWRDLAREIVDVAGDEWGNEH